MSRLRLAAAGLLLLAACSDSPTDPTLSASAQLNLDVANVAADAVVQDVDVMAGMSGEVGFLGAALVDGSAGIFLPPNGPGNMNGCGFGGGRYTCPPNSANGLTITREVAFFDAAGATQATYNAQTTARIEIEASVSGDVTRGPWSATTLRERSLIITGLEGTETQRTVNGTGEEDINRSRFAGNSPAREYDLDGTVTWADIVIPVRAPGVAPWPLSGTSTRIYTVIRRNGDEIETINRTVIITFNGTATPPATVNGEPFTINLAQRTAQRR